MEKQVASSTTYKLINSWEIHEISSTCSLQEREVELEKISQLSPTPNFPPELSLKQAPMPLHEELIVVVLWLIVFSILLFAPVGVVVLLYLRPKVAVTLIAIAFTISRIHVPFVKSSCHSYLATLCLKYFSYRIVWDRLVSTDGCLSVQPPHGLFPFGGIAAMFAMPRSIGSYGRGVAASFILSYPLVGQLLQVIGCIDATRANVEKHLLAGSSVGVSSGGIAEMFEINAPPGTECIVLKTRGGLCKLALRMGADIVPGYIFGGTKSFTAYYDHFGILQWLSRKLQAPFLFFTGRFLLPIPYRTPLLCAYGEKIKVSKIDNPSNEDIEKLLTQLEDAIVAVFDKYKACYGWQDVKLVLK